MSSTLPSNAFLIGLSGLTAFVILRWSQQPLSFAPLGSSWRYQIAWSRDPNSCKPGSWCGSCTDKTYSVPATPIMCKNAGGSAVIAGGKVGCTFPNYGPDPFYPCANPDVIIHSKVSK